MIWFLGWKRPIAKLERMRDLIPVAIHARQEELTNDSTVLWFSAAGCSLSIDDVVRRYLRRCSLVFRGSPLRSGPLSRGTLLCELLVGTRRA